MTHTPQSSFFGGDGFFLPFNAGFLIVLAFAQFGKDASFFAKLLEATDGALD
jgi:hypothetical protein